VLTGQHPHELAVYPRIAVRPVRGQGCYLEDADGRRYLDMYGGHAVALTGHAHPRVTAAIREQSVRLLFYSNVVGLDVRDRLFDVLAEAVPPALGRAFLVNSGAEANDQALAIARRATGRPFVVSFSGGFHGRTLATLAVSGLGRYQSLARAGGAGDELVARTRVCEFDDSDMAARCIDEDVAAVIVEPVQGLAGARDASPGFLRRLRELCDASGALLIFDEVQCGCARTGAFTAAQSYGVTPDVLTLAKGIASGVPMGVVLLGERVAATVNSGDLGSTFGGGPIACAAAAATLEVIADERLADNAARRGEELVAALADVPGVARVTGRGLLLGAVLDRPAKPVQQELLARGVITGGADDPSVLRLLPPLVLGPDQVSEFMDAFREVMR